MALMTDMLDGTPIMCTGMMARVLGVILASMSSGSMVNELSISAMMGTALAITTEAGVATQV